MGRIIGLIGGTCLLIAVVRLTNWQHDDHTLKADVRVVSKSDYTPREAYRRGKEMYLRGRYDDALTLLQQATASTTGLAVVDRYQAEEYLSRTQAKLASLATGETGPRGQSPDADPFGFEPAAAPANPVKDASRTRVERLMAQSIAAAKAGQREEAFKLAQQAFQFSKAAELKFSKNELTPAMLLQQIQSGQPISAPVAAAAPQEKLPDWAFDTNTVKTAAAVDPMAEFDLVAGVEPKTKPAAPAAPTTKVADATYRKNQALALIQAARVDLKAGRLDEARRKAIQAEEYDVAYDLFDDRPELVLAETDRRAGTMTVVNNTPAKAAPAATSETEFKPFAAATTAAAPATESSSPKAEATRLLAQAREDLKNGNIQAAQDKANAVQKMDVAYKLFEDRPELVLNDVAANMAASNIAAAPAAAEPAVTLAGIETAPAGDNKAEAKALLGRAREALAEGRVDEARQLAIEAERLKVSYGLFDDRPEIVLADVARVSMKGPEAKLMPAAPTAPATEDDVAAVADPKAKATQLLQEARDLMAAGNLEAAAAKAAAAETLAVTYDVFDDRPELVLTEIRQAQNGNVAKSMPAGSVDSPVQTADVSFTDSGAPAMNQQAPAMTQPAGFDVELAEVGAGDDLSAQELFGQGLAELRRGNRVAAHKAFLAAHQSGQRLDPVTNQRLQVYLRELAPKADGKIQLASQVADGELQVPNAAAPYEEPSPLDAAEQQQSVKFDRLRTDTLNAIFRAERMRESNPEQALQIIDQAIASVEGAELGADATAALLRSLQKTHESMQNEIMRQKPNLDQKKKNQEVLALLERDQHNKIRVEQEFASLVEEFNTLYQQKRFAEAEVIAKKAKELDPKNPVSETMFWKSRFARRNESNENLKLAKEESFYKQLDEVEWATVVNVGDDPIDFGSSWADITARRKGKYKADNRVRSEDELRIQESLNRRISLHEDNVPLSDVMQKISALAGFNYTFDKLGLEEEGVSPSVPVTINVDGITVRSVLNLMLEQYRLGYLVQDEVLKITSRMRQQGDLVIATYPVADLVIPIPSFTNAMGNVNAVSGDGTAGNMGGGQFSVPPAAGGQPFAQMGPNPMTGLGGIPNDMTLGPNSRLSGGSAAPDFNTLMDLISTTVAPDSWAEVGGNASIRQHGTTLSLVIRQTQRVHEEIADLLDQLRRLQDLQVTVEVRFVTVADRFFERIGIDFDFNIQPSVGGPDVDNNALPLLPFGSVLIPQAGTSGTQNQNGQQQQQQGQQQQGQQQQGSAGQFFSVGPRRELTNRSNYPKNTVVGLSAPDTFSSTLDVPFRQGSFEVGVPDFGGFNPNAGAQVGMAILSDIEAFFFIQAAQGDERSNLLFAPKVTLFNGQTGIVSSQVFRPFVISLIPTVGFFSTGFQPVIQNFSDGVSLSVQAVISADRRFVRLTVIPTFNNITDVFTFSFVGGGGTGGQQGQGQGGNLGGQGNNQNNFGGGGGGQFGIGGGMGSANMVMESVFAQQLGQTGQGGQGGQGNQNGNNQSSNLTVTVQQPVTEQVTVLTTVSVPDGGTVLLGGVKRLREGRNMAGVPILNKVPYISRLFKNTGVGRETESLMLMVTPRIIIQEEEEELLGIPTE